MGNKQLNQNIRNDISLSIINNNGSYNTRDLICKLANKYNTTKQRISGNISYVVSKLNHHQIKTVVRKRESYIY